MSEQVPPITGPTLDPDAADDRRELALPSVVLVTGTGTEIGKTIATAALTALVLARGSRVAVLKPAQTGLAPGDAGDVDVVRSLAATPETAARLTTLEPIRVPEPLAPDVAARRAGVELPTIADHARTVRSLAAEHDTVIVEGAGGLLVRLDGRGGTLADLGTALRYVGTSVGVVLVADPHLGTLNSIALSAEALAARSLPLLGVVLGTWPEDPGLAETTNVEEIPSVAGAPLLGRIPTGVGTLEPQTFTTRAPTWLTIR